VSSSAEYGTLRARVLDAIRKIHLLVLTGLTINQADCPRTVTPLRLLGKHKMKFKTSNLDNDMCVTRFKRKRKS